MTSPVRPASPERPAPVEVDTSERPDQSLLTHDLQETHTLNHTESQDNATRLMDDLELLRAERMASNEERDEKGRPRSKSNGRRHAPEPTPDDAFHTLTSQPQIPTVKPEVKPTLFAKAFKELKRFPRVLRYLVYAIPPAAVLLTPILLDLYALNGDNAVGGPGGLQLLWFGIWLEIVWCSLWLARIVVASLPLLFGICAKVVGSSNHKKWKDIGRQMEIPTALFVWMLGLISSFQPITDNHRAPGGTWTDGNPPDIAWIDIVWKVIIALFVLLTSNWLEKILIQWIATSFHVRTYSSRIEQNQITIDFLIKLYEYSKHKQVHDEPDWADSNGGPSGAKTPMKMVKDNAREAMSKFGNVAGKFAGDFTGRKVMSAGHPRKVVLELLRSTHSSHILARRIYRTFIREGAETITQDDLNQAFTSSEDAEACFGIFDKDLNGDISMEELELVCNEVHLEKKSIAASLKDLDSVVKKLDQVFLFIIFIIAVIVFIAILSGSAASALGTSGTTILGLSWMLQATAQEFLQSIIFVFVKHPFDVGDRVTVYGNTGSLGTGDDYYVQEVSLLYTEFKKMEGHIVQAPNSLLNTLFILNQRRSSGLADPIQLVLRFGTSAALIEELKARMLDFVLEHKRDYQPRIISEVRTIDEVYSVTLNVIFFHKSNFQNELLRLQRHNKFAEHLMATMSELGIEGPRKHQPGGAENFPFYYMPVNPPSYTDGQQQPGAAGGPFPSGVARAPSTSTGGPVSELGKKESMSSLREVASHTSGAGGWAAAPGSPDVLRRRRAESRARLQLERNMPDFGDVYESRRDPAAANLARLQVLREEAAQNSGGGQQQPGSPQGRSSSLERLAPLGRADTTNSASTARKRGLFFGGRPRSATNRGGSASNVDGRSDAGASMV